MAQLDHLLIVAAFGATAATIVIVALITFATLAFGVAHYLIPATFSLWSGEFHTEERAEIGSCYERDN